MDPKLLVHDIGYGLSVLLTAGVGIFALAKGVKKPVNVFFFLMCMAMTTFELSHLIGVNTVSSELSRSILMWNLSLIFIVCFNAHCTVALLGRIKESAKFLALMYVAGFGLLAYYVGHPSLFLQLSEPKSYFPNYYVAGSAYWYMFVFAAIVITYIFIELGFAYHRGDKVMKNRLKYVFFGIIFGYGFGFAASFLTYNPYTVIDPLWSMGIGIFSIPLAYAMLRYELLDVRVLTKRALLYAFVVAISSLVLGLISFSNAWITSHISSFSPWIIPVFAGLLATAIGGFIWQKIREVDILRYEFITVITHKFRTPLTYIKWSVDDLEKGVAGNEAEHKTAVDRIRTANTRLTELTDILIGLARVEGAEYLYHFEKKDFSEITRGVMDSYMTRALEKNIHFTLVSPTNPSVVSVDVSRIQFAIGILVENALMYTPKDGTITLRIAEKDGFATLGIRDSGIGISKDELPFVFSKFFRSQRARTVDTEGMGIGLFMLRSIVERHSGEVWAESRGVNQGTTFFVKLKAMK